MDQNDWVTLWQSEMAALAVDRECQERVAAYGQSWFQAAASRSDVTSREPADLGNDRPAGRSSADAASWTAPAGAAFGAGGEEIERLIRRIAELRF